MLEFEISFIFFAFRTGICVALLHILLLSFTDWLEDKENKKDEINYQKPILTDETYIQSQKQKFIEFMEKPNVNQSQNIDPLFYMIEEFREFMKTPENRIETEWKSRILFENTPRGNIVMYYDAYKSGFAYYCDISVIPYEILNAVAMKYIRTYFCMDFFIDEYELEKESKLRVHHLELPTDIKQKPISQNPTKPTITDSSVFIKSKNQTQNKNIIKEHPTASTANKLRNKFIYLGNMRNYQPLLKEKQKSTTNGFSTKLLDGITGGQKEQLTWKDYLKTKEFQTVST